MVFDAKTHVLTVVTADPDDADSLHELQLASGAREVRAVLARPGAVRALITKTYTGDLHAFALLDRAAHMQFHSMRGVFDRDAVSVVPAEPPRLEMPSRGERVLSEDDSKRPAVAPPPPRTLSAPPLPPPRTAMPTPAPVAAVSGPAAAAATLSVMTPGFSFAIPGTAQVGPSFLELLNVLVSLLENARPDLRGHSAQVARLSRRLAEKLSLDPGLHVVDRVRRVPARSRQDEPVPPDRAQLQRVRRAQGGRAASSTPSPRAFSAPCAWRRRRRSRLEHMYER